jgi:tRNA(Ile)-lysidine synthase
MARDVEKRIVRVIETALGRAGVCPGASILVGLSGGGDSVALTHALIELRGRSGLKLAAAHLNHQLRGADSDRDEEFVRAMCARLGIELIVERADDLGSSQSKANLEERARDARREFLSRAADRIGADFIALGHNRDDQAETVLMRLMRGAGAAGMAAMAERGPGRLLRPMLSISRAELRDYLNARAIPFVEDSTNESRDVLRNRIRHNLMPTLERDYAPGVAGRLFALADEMRAVDELVAAAAATELVAMRERGADGAALEIARFRSLNRAVQGGVIRQFLTERLGTLRKISRSHIEAIRDLVLEGGPSASVDIPGGWRAHRQYNLLQLIPAAAAHDAGNGFEVAIALDGVTIVEPAGFKFDAATIAAAAASMPDSLSIAIFDAAKVGDGNLVARNFVPGDRISPIGMRGTRKVHDVFVDRRLPRVRRRRFPMVMIQGRIAWIPGLVRADCAIVTKATETILRVEASEIGPL